MQRREGPRGPLHPPGTITLPEGVPELRAERLERLAKAIEDRYNWACLGHDQTRRGGADRYGRFAVHSENAETGSELTRCSSLQRAGSIAEHLVRDGNVIHGVYDLDTLVDEDDPESLPVLHKVAAVHVLVVFNTVAS